MCRVRSLLVLLPLGCGPSARPADIPPVAPDFAGASPQPDVVAMDDGEDEEEDEVGVGFGGSAADAAFDAALEDHGRSDEASDPSQADVEDGGASSEPPTEPAGATDPAST